MMAPDAKANDWSLYFGGPDKPAHRLRDVLCDMVDAQPAGGTVHFATYYLRDPLLARKLVEAHQRGVEVEIVLEAQPRSAGANDEIIHFFRNNGASDSLYLRGAGPFKHRGNLHSKIYAFSHPQPSALIGSFNPSGTNTTDDPLIAKIGDQDRGHNLLYQTKNPGLVAALVECVKRTGQGSLLSRFSSANNNTISAGAETLYFFPRFNNAPAASAVASASPSATITGAISHMKGNSLIGALTRAAEKGAAVNLIVHDTKRRVPEGVVAKAEAAGVNIARYCHKDALPMHAKFLLIEDGVEKSSWLGSYNHNSTSQWLNHEVMLKSRDPALYDALKAQFEEIAAEIVQTNA